VVSSAIVFRRAFPIVLVSLALAACGGSPNTPTPPAPVYSLAVVAFYDEDGNGRLDADEHGRVPGVTVAVGARTARTAVLTGQAIVAGVPGGAQSVTIRPDSLPPFYVAPAPVPVDVPHAGEIELPVALPVGSNLPNRYMAFGDSITVGDGSSDEQGYPPHLEDRLRMHYGVGEVINEGIDGTRTDQGAVRLRGTLPRHHPAFLLLHYGTNDWNKCDEVASCFTTDSIRDMIRQAKAANTLPVVATIIPVNVGFDARTPQSRNDYVAEQDVLIRAVVAEEGALLVDLEKAFYAAAGNDLSQLFADHVHPNDRGYQIMTDEFFKALTTPGAATPATTTLGFAGEPASTARPGTLQLRPERPEPRAPRRREP
jgi:lysophospholipase L1-like esterase